MNDTTQRQVISTDGTVVVTIDAPTAWSSPDTAGQMLVLVHEALRESDTSFVANTLVNPDAEGEPAVGMVVASDSNGSRYTEFVVLPTPSGVLGQLRTLLTEDGRRVELVTSMLSEQWSQQADDVEALHSSISVTVSQS